MTEAIVERALALHDLRAFAALLAEIPEPAWADLSDRLKAALAARGGEPESDALRRDTPLAERMRSPAAVLVRQIRLEKQRLLEEECRRRGS